LELGGGSGANFEYITEPVNWTVTEPNLCFAPYFDQTVKKLGGKHNIGNLVEVRNAWIDFNLLCHTCCSERNIYSLTNLTVPS